MKKISRFLLISREKKGHDFLRSVMEKKSLFSSIDYEKTTIFINPKRKKIMILGIFNLSSYAITFFSFYLYKKPKTCMNYTSDKTEFKLLLGIMQHVALN